MKLFVSGNLCNGLDKLNSFELVDNINDSTTVLILPGGLGTMSDLFYAISNDKDVVLYNRDFFYTSIIKKLFELYEEGIEIRRPSEYMDIECEIEEVIKKLEERL